MADIRATNGELTVVGHCGDAKTLLAFDLASEAARADLAGFTIMVTPDGLAPYFLLNNLRFEHPEQHAQDPTEPAFSTLNAPLHKFRWLHVPGVTHQGLEPVFGTYRYTVTPRYFANNALLPLDAGKSVSIDVPVQPFVSGKLRLGFTRGFTQSQAFVRHFGLKALIKPRDSGLIFDTLVQSGSNALGDTYTFEQQYKWLGFTARTLIFEMLGRMDADANLELDLFAYDLNEPDFCAALLKLAPTKRVRVILDDAALHHDKTPGGKLKPEDDFEQRFTAAAGPGMIKRGNFGRYAHDKVIVLRTGAVPGTATSVLTGSTNFSVTGLYVNSNHVLVFDDADVATTYATIFQQVWDENVANAAFTGSPASTADYTFPTAGGTGVPSTTITFSPHSAARASAVLERLTDRIDAEAKTDGGSVMFAVMQLDGGKTNPAYTTLSALHETQTIFSYGISDTPKGIALYKPGTGEGVLATGKPVNTQLPPPFNQVPGVGLGHQIHHKFVVCGFNGDDPTVFCGSSNLALLGEQVNGDNLLMIKDKAVATAFMIEAVALVDHFQFLDRAATGSKKDAAPPANKQQAAVKAQWFLGTTDRWVGPYFDVHDLHCIDRELFVR